MDWYKLMIERNEWVSKNFDEDSPGAPPVQSIMGTFEELGELSHAHLKQEQGIRGTDEEHELNAKDAIGDLSIYLMGVMNRTGTPREIADPKGREAWEVLLELGAAVGTLGIRQSRYDVERIVSLSLEYCASRGWDYEEIVCKTWEAVKKRDWKANPQDGKVNA